MNPPHDHHQHHSHSGPQATDQASATIGDSVGTAGQHASLNRVALMATAHCLSGCAIGEITGMVLGTALGWTPTVTVIAATLLAFVSGYLLTLRPLLQSGMALTQGLAVALAADTASIAVMEVVDNVTMVLLPDAMNASLTSVWFWAALALALGLGGLAAFPVNRWLIARGRGHAIVHAHH